MCRGPDVWCGRWVTVPPDAPLQARCRPPTPRYGGCRSLLSPSSPGPRVCVWAVLCCVVWAVSCCVMLCCVVWAVSCCVVLCVWAVLCCVVPTEDGQVRSAAGPSGREACPVRHTGTLWSPHTPGGVSQCTLHHFCVTTLHAHTTSCRIACHDGGCGACFEFGLPYMPLVMIDGSVNSPRSVPSCRTCQTLSTRAPWGVPRGMCLLCALPLSSPPPPTPVVHPSAPCSDPCALTPACTSSPLSLTMDPCLHLSPCCGYRDCVWCVSRYGMALSTALGVVVVSGRPVDDTHCGYGKVFRPRG